MPRLPGRRGPADERRHGARGSADHDVLRRRALQPARVDDDVERAAGEREHGGEDVDGAREQDEGERQEHEAELERAARGDASRGDRPRLRPLAHERVDVAVEDVVERRRAAAREREADHRGDRDLGAGPAVGAGDHPAEARDEQERHDPRLRQRDVVAPAIPTGCARRGSSRRRRPRSPRARGPRASRAPSGPGTAAAAAKSAAATSAGATSRRCANHADDDERSERRRDERGKQPVRRAEPGRAGDDREHRPARGDERRQAEPRARRDAGLTSPPPRAAGAGRAAAAGSSRTGRSRSCAPAAARSCTTRACRRATGRSRRARPSAGRA